MLALAEETLQSRPHILAKVVEREFLYNFGLSLPGTLGVDQVRYDLEVVDVWQTDGALVKGMTVSVATPGGCERLMNKDGRYLVAIDQAGLTAPASASSAASENDGAAIPNQWQSDCSVTNELEAKAAIATLNQQRLGNPSVLHLSAN